MSKSVVLVATLCTILSALQARADALVFPNVGGMSVEILGWDKASQRIYYVTLWDAKQYRWLSYYDTRSSSDFQPHLFKTSDGTVSATAKAMRREIAHLKASLTPMTSVDSVSQVPVYRTRARVVDVDDVSEVIADFQIEWRGLSGAWTSYDVCNGPMTLVTRRVALTPNGKYGIALVEGAAGRDCHFALAIPISKRPIPPLQREWNQPP